MTWVTDPNTGEMYDNAAGSGEGPGSSQGAANVAAPAAAKAPQPTTPAPQGQKWVYNAPSNTWVLGPMSQGESLQQTLNNPAATAAPVVPYANQGASASQPAAGTQTFATNYGGQSNQNTPAQTYTAEQLSPSTGGVGAGGVAKPQGGVIGVDPGYVATNRSSYDVAAQRYQQSIDTFQTEIDRLSGVDPFGNQAFLRQATDRAAAQAGGLAAGGLSTATARAGNMRQAQGVQAGMAAEGRDKMAIQRSQDEVQAGALRSQNATGLANVTGQMAGNELEIAKMDVQTGMANMDAYLKKYQVDAQLKQQDIESLRNVNVELQKLGEQSSEADVNALLQKYGIDENTKVALKQIAQSGKFTLKDVVGGLFGVGAAVAGGLATKSDRRSKFDVRDPDLRDLEDFLGKAKGKLYRYKDPSAPGQRKGLNFGPMAQNLQESKIGATVVYEGKDGLYVDTQRLALTDHAALVHLASEIKLLKSGK